MRSLSLLVCIDTGLPYIDRYKIGFEINLPEVAFVIHIILLWQEVHCDNVKDGFSPSKVKKWAIDDLNRTISWLENQDEKVK